MSSYLTQQQHAQLLKPINPNRVGKDGKNFSHVEAYEIRAHLNRVFGFARWSADLTDLTPVFETDKDGKWTVCYRATVRLTVCAPDGTPLATYTEAATGEAKNQPSRGDAHDLAIKTAESQAFKRCAVNLGDQYGASLYMKGSLAPLVRATLVQPTGAAPEQAAAPVDSHITEPLPAEGEAADDKREKNPPAPPPQSDDRTAKDAVIAKLRAEVLAAPTRAGAPWFARKQLEATKAGIMKMLVEDRDGNMVTVGAFLQQEQARGRAA